MDRPIIPENLSELSADQLGELMASLRAFAADRRGDPTAGAPDATAIADLGWAVDTARVLAAEQTARTEAAATSTATLSAVDELLAPPAEPATTVVDTPPVAVVPAAVELAPASRADTAAIIASASTLVPAAATPAAAPVPTAPSGAQVALVASVNGEPTGRSLDFGAFGELMQRAGDAYRGGSRAQDVIVATAHVDVPEDAYASPSNSDQVNSRLMRESIGRRLAAWQAERSLVATGGVCGPADVLRAINVISDDSRPVAGMFPMLPSRRGSVLFTRTPALADVAGGVDTITSAEDLAGKTKACFDFDCPSQSTATVAGVSACMTVGVMQNFSNPEWVQGNVTKLMAVWARVAETQLLNDLVGFAQGPGAVINVGDTVYGAYRTFVRAAANLVAAYRDGERYPDDLPVVWALPGHSLLQMAMDLAGSTYDLALVRQVRSEFAAEMAELGVSPQFYRDSPTPGANVTDQTFAIQGDGPIDPFPGITEGFMVAEGVVGYLQAPGIDYGFTNGMQIVDGTLVRTNDVRWFAEIFETLVDLGGGPVWQTRIITCPHGAAAGPADSFTPACAS